MRKYGTGDGKVLPQQPDDPQGLSREASLAQQETPRDRAELVRETEED